MHDLACLHSFDMQNTELQIFSFSTVVTLDIV